MRKLSIAVLIAAIAVIVALTGCGGGGGGSLTGGSGGTTDGGTTTPGGGGTSTAATIVRGTVRDNFAAGSRPVQNVVITLGSFTTNTDASGNFSFNLGSNVTVASLFTSPSDAVFKVSTRLLDQSQYPQVSVFYIVSTGYEQSAETGGASIPLPFEVYTSAAGTNNNLGLITIQFNDPANPPPVPF